MVSKWNTPSGRIRSATVKPKKTSRWWWSGRPSLGDGAAFGKLIVSIATIFSHFCGVYMVIPVFIFYYNKRKLHWTLPCVCECVVFMISRNITSLLFANAGISIIWLIRWVKFCGVQWTSYYVLLVCEYMFIVFTLGYYAPQGYTSVIAQETRYVIQVMRENDIFFTLTHFA